MQPFTISFPGGQHALGVSVTEKKELASAFKLLGLHASRPVLVLVGGASGLDAQHEAGIQNILQTLAQIAQHLQAALLDGGTRSGVMALMGETYSNGKHSFPLIGVAVERKVRWPGNDKPEAHKEVEPRHTHFLFVPGSEWGEESIWLTESASALALSQPSLTILINGGEISRQDVLLSLQAGRPVLVAAGTGRLADEFAASPPSPLLHVVAATDLNALSSKLLALLTRS